MQIKNISGHDISFMFKSPKSTDAMPVFDTVNIVAGWTVLIDDEIFAQLKEQTKTVMGFTEEVVEITEGGAKVRSNGGEVVTPKKVVRQWDGTVKEVNLIEHLIRTREIEIVESLDEPALPDRKVLEAFLKRFGEKVTEKMTDEQVIEKVKQLKAELAAVEAI